MKTGLTRLEELEIVLLAIKCYALKHDVDVSEISNLMTDGCEEFSLPDFVCPLTNIVEGHSMLAQGKKLLKPKRIVDYSKRISVLLEQKEEIKQTLILLPSCEVGKHDELLLLLEMFALDF